MSETSIVDAIAREMQTGALVLDSEKRILYANPFFLKSFALSGVVEGRPLSEIIGDRILLDTVKVFFKDGRNLDEDIEIKEGPRVFNIRPVPLDEKTGPALLLFIRDITEEKRVEAIKKDFVANVSHELRTPLASIKGYSETLLDGGMAEETGKDFLRIIDKNATRMSRLIDDLLILSRLESQQMTIECESLDITDLISSTLLGFKKSAADKGISLSGDTPEELPKVEGDRDRLEQVVVNLLDNAIKYTPSGGSVSVAVAAGEDEVRVDVKDTGIGIPARDIARIFERFYRVDKARSRELGGTGLGLAIVKHIIQGHSGRVWVESEPGIGSTFSFTIPL
ncbi:MAG: ATP-binding protein [Thermodesulfobacteriota bacterium]